MVRNPLLFVVVLAGFLCSYGQEDYSGWAHSKDLTINTSASGYNITENLTDFPFLVRLTSSDFDFTQARPQGQDVRFTTASGTHLPYQIETWDAAARTAAIWVKVTQIAGNNATQAIKLYWGKADAADSSNGGAVFATANGFAAAYHFSPADSLVDATGHGLSLTNSQTAASTALIGRGRSLSGAANTYLSTVDTAALNMTTTVTVSAWIKPADAATDQKVFGKSTWPPRGYLVGLNNNQLDPEFWDTAGTDHRPSGGTIASGRWSQVAVSWTTGGQMKSYVNGVEVNSTAAGTLPLGANGQKFYIGCSGWDQGSMLYKGDIDEVVVATAARSAAWIRLAYLNQRFVPDSAPKLSYGVAALTIEPGTPIDSIKPTLLSGFIDSLTVTPPLPAGLTLNPQTAVITGYTMASFPATAFRIRVSNETGFTEDTLTITAQGNGTTENYSQWPHASAITINTAAQAPGYGIGSDLVNFPYLLRFAGDEFPFAEASRTGKDIRFANAAGTHLPYYIEQWDSTAGIAAVWVKVDTIRGNNSSQSIKMHWGMPNAPDSSRGRYVFSTADGFVAAYHFSQADSLRDATLNGLHLTNSNTAALASSLIGSGRSLSGAANTYLSAPDNGPMGVTTEMTLSAWVKPVDAAADQKVFGKNVYPGRGYLLGVKNNAIDPECWDNAGTGFRPSGGKIGSNRWSHVAVTWTTGGKLISYVNGVAANTIDASSLPLSTNTNKFYIGCAGWTQTDLLFKGDLDEVTVSNSARTADWIKLAFLNQRVLPSAPPTIKYPKDSILVPVGSFIETTVPVITGEYDSLSLSGSLPDGLTFDYTTGEIKGIGMTVDFPFDVFVTVYNAVGSSSDTVNILVDNVTSSLDKSRLPAGKPALIGLSRSTTPALNFVIPSARQIRSVSFSLLAPTGRVVWSTHLAGAQLRDGLQSVNLGKKKVEGYEASASLVQKMRTTLVH
jgi:hypothetical protein